MTEHAPLFQASGAARWIACPGSVKLSEGLPDETSSYAERGTRMHQLAADMLHPELSADAPLDMPAEDVEEVEFYVDLVLRFAKGGDLMVEQRVDFSHVLQQPDCFGTADAIILHSDLQLITVVDLKTGRHAVDPDGPQLKLYALGALRQYDMLGEFKTVRLVVVQGGVGHVHDTTAAELEEFAREARAAAEEALSAKPFFQPGEKQCRFCKAKAHCPALAERVADTIGQDFENLDAEEVKADPDRMGLNYLSHCMSSVALVEDWCKGIRARVERELLAGNEIDGWKLVQGRKGARKWSSDQEAEAQLRKMKLKVEDIYDLKVISPTSAEKLHKAGTIGPRQWPQLQALITQSDGGLSVAPASDKRPAASPVASADEFETV